MFEIADRLVGIYKTYDVTKTIMYQPNLRYYPLLYSRCTADTAVGTRSSRQNMDVIQ